MLDVNGVMRIGERAIGPSERPFVIAEMSGNHNGSLDRALAIVDAAAQAGASAIKLQTYTADTMTLDMAEGEFFLSDPSSLWRGQSMHELYASASTPWEWHGPIMERAAENGILAFSSPLMNPLWIAWRNWRFRRTRSRPSNAWISPSSSGLQRRGSH